MVAERIQRAALLGLLHDLPAVVRRYAPTARGLGSVLELALPASAAEQALIERASAYAAAGGASTPLVHEPLRAVLTRLQSGEGQEGWAGLGNQPEALGRGQAPGESARAEFVAAMCDTLAGLVAQLDLHDFAQSYPALLDWMERFGRGLPAHRDDLPLAAHARLASAAAACLEQQPDGAFGLVGIALVGERSYCLGAAGKLGRLFARASLLAALNEALVHTVAERAGVPFGNAIAHDGERCVLLVPARAGAVLAELERELNQHLYAAFAGELALALAFVPLGDSEATFGAELGTLASAMDIAVLQCGRGALNDTNGWHEDAFVLREQSFATHRPCAACGRLPGSAADGLCPHCARDEQLRTALAGAGALAFYRAPITGGIEIFPGWYLLAVVEGNTPPSAPALLALLGEALPATRLDVPGRLPASETGVPFGHAGSATHTQGHAQLGYAQIQIEPLRAFMRKRPTSWNAAHTVALSHELALLRTRWLRQLLNPPRYRAFATIGIGASTLLLGPWDQVAALTLECRALLRRASGGARPACAAGVLVAKTGYPLARAIAEADTMQARAQLGAAEFRDRITLLGDTVDWGEAPAIFAEVARLQPHGHSIGAPLLRDLAAYGRLQRLWREAGRTEGLRYKALFTYSLARALRRGDAELYRWADEIIRSLHGTGDNIALRHIGVIATYLLLSRHDD